MGHATSDVDDLIQVRRFLSQNNSKMVLFGQPHCLLSGQSMCGPLALCIVYFSYLRCRTQEGVLKLTRMNLVLLVSHRYFSDSCSKFGRHFQVGADSTAFDGARRARRQPIVRRASGAGQCSLCMSSGREGYMAARIDTYFG